MIPKTKILVIDDQLGARGSVHNKAFLRAYSGLHYEFGFESCYNGSEYSENGAIKSLREHPDAELILLDIKFGREDDRLGYRILHNLTTQVPSLPVLMMSSVDRDIESLGRCLEDGAVGFVAKDLKPEDFQKAVERALVIARSHVLLGQSSLLRELRRQAARLSPYDQIPVMIVGGRGSGKERVARYIHHNGPRSSGPFTAVNCAGLAESLLESELFGAEKGAYTGASTTRIGYLERASHGILFLDEIGNMPMATQAKLLRALQDKSFRRVGVSQRELTADFQVICASNIEPDELIRHGKLREDFYDRVAAVTVRTPPLNKCKSDIPELANHFLRELGVHDKKEISVEVLDVLNQYAWPGNIRELRRVVQEAVVVSENFRVIKLEHIPPQIRYASIRGFSAGTEVLEKTPACLPDDPSEWPRERLLSELRLALEAKRRIQRYKGNQWKAELMRLMYPECKAANAKGFDDLIRRLTKGPWGSAGLLVDPEARRLISDLKE